MTGLNGGATSAGIGSNANWSRTHLPASAEQQTRSRPKTNAY